MLLKYLQPGVHIIITVEGARNAHALGGEHIIRLYLDHSQYMTEQVAFALE